MIHPAGATTMTASNWKEAGGHAWAELQDLLDRLHQPIGEAVEELAQPTPGERILDVGCGGGATTLDLARRLRPGGVCVGVDISAPLLELARKRARLRVDDPAVFVEGDAETYRFQDGEFDAVASRFGVMFFGRPAAAFANLRRATKPGGRLAFACWRSPRENPLSQIPLEAAAPFLSEPPPPLVKDGPGRFAFADPDRVRQILDDAGWRNVEIRPIDVPTLLSFEELVKLSLQLGALGPLLRHEPEAVRRKVQDAVEARLRPLVQNGLAPMTAACWLVNASC